VYLRLSASKIVGVEGAFGRSVFAAIKYFYKLFLISSRDSFAWGAISKNFLSFSQIQFSQCAQFLTAFSVAQVLISHILQYPICLPSFDKHPSQFISWILNVCLYCLVHSFAILFLSMLSLFYVAMKAGHSLHTSPQKPINLSITPP